MSETRMAVMKKHMIDELLQGECIAGALCDLQGKENK
jgi:hypothetical protein